MAEHLRLAMTNVEQLLERGGMDLGDVLSLTVHVTDMDAAIASYQAITERLDACGATPPATLVGVTRLALPTMLVEITAPAAVATRIATSSASRGAARSPVSACSCAIA